ncbi:MAG TPA: phosphatase PAP2 family protein [Puia sp.]|jgi:membrane-associated phospholipid phosphatase|nr:phosphatase PAP2 family protein [Puia sp.]
MKEKVVSDNRQFFVGFFLLMILMIVLLVIYSKADSFIVLNPYHSKALNYFFIVYTNVGDGLFSIAIAVIFLFYKRFLIGIEIIVAFLLSGAIVQLLKYFFPMARPSVFLANAHCNHFIENVTLTGHASFPSGHAASAFALATLLSLFDKNKNRSWLYLFLVALVGYSRIYLGQHFLQDVFWGSVDGFVCGLIVYFVIKKNISRRGAKNTEKRS